MERPKRRKYRDNPYTLEFKENKYYIRFKDITNNIQIVEVSEEVYKIFDKWLKIVNFCYSVAYALLSVRSSL